MHSLDTARIPFGNVFPGCLPVGTAPSGTGSGIGADCSVDSLHMFLYDQGFLSEGDCYCLSSIFFGDRRPRVMDFGGPFSVEGS